MSSGNTKALMADLAARGRIGLEFAKKNLLAEEMDYPKLREALEHYVNNWKDFTHGGLFSLACEAVKGKPEAYVPIQASITIMAAAFDIHDDIIDKSKTKHSTPTVYGKYGEEIALLLGNAFWVESFTLLTRSVANLAPEKTTKILMILKENLFDVGNAHALEIGLKGKSRVAPANYVELVKKKAASIEADMHIGALIGGGTEEEAKALASYGRTIGTLTTLREEFIDIFEAEELTQKIATKQLPIPMLFAMKEPERKKRIKKILERRKLTNENLDELVDIVLQSKYVKKLRGEMGDLIDQATCLLSKLPRTRINNELRLWVSSMLEDL